jgi:hypothetical protein
MNIDNIELQHITHEIKSMLLIVEGLKERLTDLQDTLWDAIDEANEGG